MHNESSGFDQFHVRRDRMFHITRWKRPTIASALSVLALSVALTSHAMAAGKTISAVMHADLRTPGMMTTAYIVRDFGYMIFDTLLAQDANFKIQPQMAEWKVSDDKLTYTFTLRDGLKWHDGAPVTAEDCVASLKRWGKADGMGQKLMDFTASIEATDAKTISLKLKEPYSLVLESIGKPSSLVPFMMPKRMAEAPTDKPLPELIGSGPFKFVPAEFQAGVKAVFEKNKDYVPRKEQASWTSGGKVVKVDRVEWITMADAQTAVNALQSGDIDFLEVPSYDILPVLAANKDIKIETPNKLGFQTVGRMNFLLPPFDNVKVRRAALLAMNQKDVLDALIGNPEYFKICGAFFMCGTPIVIMAPGDVVTLKAQPVVAAQALRAAGFKVDLQATDWGTVVSRRTSQKPIKEGGWNMFFTNWAGADVINPIVNFAIGGKGKNGGWFGWADDPKIEQLKDAFVRAATPEEQKTITADIQKEAYDQVIYIPLGEYTQPSAWRKSLTGVLDGPATPVFWNIDKSE